jgi:23S rRNA (pseudouridine1915-N3)-methyltransferase
MRFVVLAVGRIRERGLRETVDEYLGRLRRYAAVDEIELKDGLAPKLAAAAARRIPEGARVIVLDDGGKAYTSEGFARHIERLVSQGKGVLAFVIGGADGVPADLAALSHERLSLSAMTLPHRLARLVLLEQLYRAMTILRGEPYPR